MREFIYKLAQAGRAFIAVIAVIFAASAAADSGRVIVAGGGEITFNNATTNWIGGDLLLKFSASDQDASFTLPGTTKARILAVGGGGGGGATFSSINATTYAGGIGGGGGAGGVVHSNALFRAGVYTVAVGGGGASGVVGSRDNSGNREKLPGGDGTNTVIRLDGEDWITALGGGGGGGESVGRAGAGGGGGSKNKNSNDAQPGGDGLQGGKGGVGDAALSGGGGGGAADDGQKASLGGAGGAGFQNDITDTAVWYGVGGHGGAPGYEPQPVADCTGSGGDGAGKGQTPCAGGSGVVYVRIAASIDGGLNKPTDKQVKYNGDEHVLVSPAPSLYTIVGDWKGTEIGTYVAKVKPMEGIYWDEATQDNEEVTVTLTVAAADSKSGSIEITGAQVEYFGAAEEPQWINGDLLLKFTDAGCYKLPGTTKARILTVGGGGGGGATFSSINDTTYAGGIGGGGGAGGVVHSNALFRAGVYTVAVGGGGAPGVVGSRDNSGNREKLPGGDGTNTVIRLDGEDWITALGGGGGGGESVGRAGAGGGGGSKHKSNGDQSGGVGLQGGKGGVGDTALSGGGGGGAAAGGDGNGQDASQGGAGGAGVQNDITDAAVWYGVGGHGGAAGYDPQPVADCTGSGGDGAGKGQTPGSGGSGVVYVRISNTMNGNFEKPVVDPAAGAVITNIVYDGEWHTPYDDTVYYTVVGDKRGRDVNGSPYVVTIKLRENMSWPDGGQEDITVKMNITPCPLTITDLDLPDFKFGTVRNPRPIWTTQPQWVADKSWLSYQFSLVGEDDWSGRAPTDSGDYEVRVVLNPDRVDVRNFDYPEPAKKRFSILPIEVKFSEFSLRDWMYGTPTEALPQPMLKIDTDVDGAVVTPKYEYAKATAESGEDRDWSQVPDDEWTLERPSDSGRWWIRVSVPDSNHIYMTGFGPLYLKFEILAGLGNLYQDWVDITNIHSSASGSLPSPFPLTIELYESNEDNPPPRGTRPFGFRYDRVDLGGETMAVTDMDGKVLPYVVQSWEGEPKKICVRLDSLSSAPQSIRLFWNLREGKDVPKDMYGNKYVYSDYNQSAAEAAMATASPKYEFDLVYTNGFRVNYFLKFPKISKNEWPVGDDAGEVTLGELAEGGIKVTYINAGTKLPVGTSMPTACGVYRIIFEPETPGYAPLMRFIDFRISGSIAIEDLGGDVGDATINGRVFLANDDAEPGHEISGQAPWRVREVGGKIYNPYWVHSGAVPNIDASYAYLRADGVDHELVYISPTDGVTNTIWRFVNVLFGNCLSENKDNRFGARVHLPWSPTSLSIVSANAGEVGSGVNAKCDGVGNIVFRDILDARVESKYYPEGIGTIYFDAVNSAKYNNVPFYKLVVEVSKLGSDNTEGAWERQLIYPLKHNGGDGFEECARVEELSLEIDKNGSCTNFYRAYVPVNCSTPARFRIRRTAVSNSGSENDNGNFIIMDNLMVSYPRATAETTAYGEFDGGLTGTKTLGQKAAMMTPFPAVGDGGILARAKPTAKPTKLVGNDWREFITYSRMHYRWRYLDQVVSEDDWKTIDLHPADDYIAHEPLKLPDLEGDVEFWYETFVQVPFYKYHDYSGLGWGLNVKRDGEPQPVAAYTEEETVRTNRMEIVEGKTLASGGRDWFFRLRPGKSDYESVKMLVEGVDETAAEWLTESEVSMRLVKNHVWRGFLRTPTNATGKVKFRFEGVNRQQPGDTNYVASTVYWKLASDEEVSVVSYDDASSRRGSGTLMTCGSEDRSVLEVDNLSNYVMVQIDDEANTLAVVHGDKQDFNRWNDAHNDKFVGQVSPFDTSTKDENDDNFVGVIGTSDLTRRMDGDIVNWPRTVTETDSWAESFTVAESAMGSNGAFPLEREFTSAKTPNGWSAGPGMWVATRRLNSENKWDPPNMALQMRGQGYGYLQFVNEAAAPKGLGKVSFSARLAQTSSFEEFCYWYQGPDNVRLANFTNYTFFTKATFDINNGQDFYPGASISLIAYYLQNCGCYEVRLTRHAEQRYDLAIYRWTVDEESGEADYQLLTELKDYDFSSQFSGITREDANDTYPMLFLSCSTEENATVVRAGVCKSKKSLGNSIIINKPSDNDRFVTIACKDSGKQRLMAGTIGVSSASCPAHFYNLAYFRSFVGGTDSPSLTNNYDATFTWGAPSFLNNSIQLNEWTPLKRMERNQQNNNSLYGFKAREPVQTLYVYTAKSGTEEWDIVNTNDNNVITISGFGGSNSQVEKRLYFTDDCSVQFKTGGNLKKPRYDIVIDDVRIEPWRGDTFDDSEVRDHFGAYEVEEEGAPTNFVFTQTWIMTNSVGESRAQLSAKRSRKDMPTSIRSPLMDGKSGRGSGLGMISFAYANAQPNTELVIQIYTNEIQVAALRNISKRFEGWQDVTNVTFKTAAEASGNKSFYLGLHGVKGLMRILLKPDLVDAVANETNPNRFGSIDILSVSCTDEPELGARSWWGWNLRTTDEKDRIWIGDQPTSDNSSGGMAFALNSHVTEETLDSGELYKPHLPFLQTPALRKNMIGEISFRARKYDTDKNAYIVMYGSRTGGRDPDADWHLIKAWPITDNVYRSYDYQMPQGSRFASVRLAVVGVDGVTSYMKKSDPRSDAPEEFRLDPNAPYPAVRVLIDEVEIFESVDARVAFKNVRPFRSWLENNRALPDEQIMSDSEQPLVGEVWGVQGEVFAAQLADVISFAPGDMHVYLHWYEGVDPWGFDNWRNSPDAGHAELQRSDDSTHVFRSSYIKCPSAVIPRSLEPVTMQYMLEVAWKTKDNFWVTNRVESTDWIKPKWYRGIDYNSQYGTTNKWFSCYTLLDTVAPNWAWINEVNIFGGEERSANIDEELQYVEIAAPSDADLTGWSVRLLTADERTVTTNTVATFGSDGLPATKRNLKGATSNMVFHVITSEKTWNSKKNELSAEDGTKDGIWAVKNLRGYAISASGEITMDEPVGIQLVRANKIVDHEIVVIGTNAMEKYSAAYPETSPTSVVSFLNKRMRAAEFFFAGADDLPDRDKTDTARKYSLGVWDSRGEASNFWSRAMLQTPGRINKSITGKEQTLPSMPPRSNGDTLVVFCNLNLTDHEREIGRLTQTVGMEENTSYDTIIIMPKGSEEGTNIVYAATNWYKLGMVTTNGVALPASAIKQLDGPRLWSVNVGKGMSNSFTVAVSPDVCDRLRELGLDDSNRYKDAIMAWFNRGTYLDGTPWPLSDDDQVETVDYRDLGFKKKGELSLNEMYWLDICPTIPNQHLMGGFKKAPLPKTTTAAPSRNLYSSWMPDDENDLDAVTTNLTSLVFMAITNSETGKVYAPYVIRGVDPDYTSQNYSADRQAGRSVANWSSASLKIAGLLADSFNRVVNSEEDNWVLLRKFVLDANSFTKADDANPFTAEVEIADSRSEGTIGYREWAQWVERYRDGIWPNIFYRLELNDRNSVYEVKVLKTKNPVSSLSGGGD